MPSHEATRMPVPGRVLVATCQFPVDAEIGRNLGHISRQLRQAAARGAQVVHFPECALSGYAGSDFPSYDGYDWTSLEQATRAVMALASELSLWVVLGSTHRLSEPHKPPNSLYIIDSDGQLVDRYDKRFCAGDTSERSGDLAHYTPGDHFSTSP